MSEVIFEVQEDTIDGGFTASALGLSIHTQADTMEEMRANVRGAVDCYFDEGDDALVGLSVWSYVAMPCGPDQDR